MRITRGNECVEIADWVWEHIANNPPSQVSDLEDTQYGYVSQHAVWRSVHGRYFLDQAVPLLPFRRCETDWMVEHIDGGLIISRDLPWGPKQKWRWKHRPDEIEVTAKETFR